MGATMEYWQAICNEFYNRHAKGYSFQYTSLQQYSNYETATPNTYDKKNYPFSNDESLYLTQREADCVYHMLLGLTIKETAEELLLSPRTVEFYLKRIKDKFGQKSKKSLLLFIESSPYFKAFYCALEKEFTA